MDDSTAVGILFIVLIILAMVGAAAIINVVLPDVVDYCQEYAFEYGYNYTWIDDGKGHSELFCVRGAVFGEPEIMSLPEVRERCNSNGDCDGR